MELRTIGALIIFVIVVGWFLSLLPRKARRSNAPRRERSYPRIVAGHGVYNELTKDFEFASVQTGPTSYKEMDMEQAKIIAEDAR